MRDQVLALIRGLVEARNMGLLLIGHDLQQVSEHCERVMVMYKGRLLEYAARRRFAGRDPSHTRTLWACRPAKRPTDRRYRCWTALRWRANYD